MSAAQYKLTYFNLRGLGEVPRLVFAAAGQAYTDHRLPFERNADGTFNTFEWASNPALKEATPFHKLPVLEVDGVTIAQSMAISRFLAKRFGLFGATDIEGAQVDQVCEQIQDIRKAYWTAREKDGANKPATPEASEVRKFITEALPTHHAFFEKLLNKAGKGYLVGDKLSLADISFYYVIYILNTEGPAVETLDKFPGLKKLYETVANQEGIKKHVETRPVTLM